MVNLIEERCKYLKDKKEEIMLVEEIDSSEVYKIIIDEGKNLNDFEDSLKISENKVKGCMSNVFISAEFIDGKIYFKGSSDSQIVAGFVAILINALSGLTPKEIVKESEKCINEFLVGTHIKASLTPSRANAFGNIYCLMKEKAAKFIK